MPKNRLLLIACLKQTLYQLCTKRQAHCNAVHTNRITAHNIHSLFSTRCKGFKSAACSLDTSRPSAPDCCHIMLMHRLLIMNASSLLPVQINGSRHQRYASTCADVRVI